MQTQTVGAFEAKTHLSSLLDEVEQGRVVFITKHGRPVAKLSPISTHKEDIQKTIDNIKAFQSRCQISLNEDWKVLRDEGRRG